MRIKNSNVRTIRILLHSSIIASIVRKDVLYERHRILKHKKKANYGWDF